MVATCGTERNVMKRSGTKVGDLAAAGYNKQCFHRHPKRPAGELLGQWLDVRRLQRNEV